MHCPILRMTALSLCISACVLFCSCTNGDSDGSPMWGADPETHAHAWGFVGNQGFSTADVRSPMIAINPLDDSPYVVYAGSANVGITVRRYNGSAWEDVGDLTSLSGVYRYPCIAFAPNGTPYIAYADGPSSNKATVQKYEAGVWTVIWGVGISEGQVDYIDLAIDSAGTPYVAYNDAYYSGGAAVVKKDNGSMWAIVGAAPITTSTAFYTSLTFDSSSDPYFAYEDGSLSNKASVQHYISSWSPPTGSLGFSDGAVSYVSLVVDGSNTLYVGYNDAAVGGAAVKKWTGSTWDPVGYSIISPGSVDCMSMKISPNGYLCVAYGDSTTNPQYKAVVKQCTGSEWTTVGGMGFSPGSAFELTMDIDSKGVIYVAFRDPTVSEKATVMAFK